VNGDGGSQDRAEPPDGGAPENMKLAPESVLSSSALLQNSTLIRPFSPVNACHLAFVLTLDAQPLSAFSCPQYSLPKKVASQQSST